MIIEATSDLHGNRPRLHESIHTLVVAGDIGWNGHVEELEPYISWMGAQPHKHKLFVPGNHDKSMEKAPNVWKKRFADVGVHMLVDEGITLDGISFYGYPHTPPYMNWAFMPRDEVRKLLAADIPSCDVLISHGPPWGVLDTVKRKGEFWNPCSLQHCTEEYEELVGCRFLTDRLREIKVKVMIFGHIHQQHGFKEVNGTRYYNVAWPMKGETVLLEIEDRPLTIDDF